MSVALAYWLIYLVWVALTLCRRWFADGPSAGGGLLLFALLFLLGLAVFGPPIRW